MKVEADTSGVNRLIAKLENLGSIDDALLPIAKREAENMRSTAQGMVYLAIRYETGETGDSIDPYVEQSEDGVSFGTHTRNLRTIYHELGTGPVGTAAGYPGAANLDQPIVRRSTAWKYWSDSIPTEDGGTRSGFVKTEGVRPKAFMHSATMQERANAERAVSTAIKELMK